MTSRKIATAFKELYDADVSPASDIKGHRCRDGAGCRMAKPRPESSVGQSRHQQIRFSGSWHQYRRSEETAGYVAD